MYRLEGGGGNHNPTFNVEFFFENQEQVPDPTTLIESNVDFVPYLVDHKSVEPFSEGRDLESHQASFTLTEVVKNGKYWKDDAKKLKKELYLGCRKANAPK